MSLDTDLKLVEEALSEKRDMSQLFGFTDEQYDTAQRLAYRLYKNGKYEKAVVILKGLIGLNKPKAYPYVLLGDIAWKSLMLSDAKTCWEKAHEYEPEDTWTSVKLAELYTRMHMFDDALKLLDQVGELDGAGDVLLRRRAQSIRKAIANTKAS